jgi:hypothetical protein
MRPSAFGGRGKACRARAWGMQNSELFLSRSCESLCLLLECVGQNCTFNEFDLSIKILNVETARIKAPAPRLERVPKEREARAIVFNRRVGSP